MKKPLFLLIFLPLLGVAVSAIWWRSASGPVDVLSEEFQAFVISRGQSASQVARRLESAGLIKSQLAFRFYVQLTGRSGSIQAGEFLLSPGFSLQETVSALLSGPRELWVTYPEGFRREQMAEQTWRSLGLDASAASVFVGEFMVESDGLEGFLFPDTYLFPRDVTASRVVRKLRATFQEKVSGQILEDIADIPLSLEEVVILASIVERETLSSEERPVVAGILLKRLENKWPLETDANVQYVVGGERCIDGNFKIVPDCSWWEPTTIAQREVDSPYNTYGRLGLPAGPIANPGLDSIRAVVYPRESDYWFYLHDKDGNIHYAKTAQEHAENVRRYVK